MLPPFVDDTHFHFFGYSLPQENNSSGNKITHLIALLDHVTDVKREQTFPFAKRFLPELVKFNGLKMILDRDVHFHNQELATFLQQFLNNAYYKRVTLRG